MGYFAPDPDVSSGYFGPVDPSLFGDPNSSKSAPFGIPSLNFTRGSPAAALVARAMRRLRHCGKRKNWDWRRDT